LFALVRKLSLASFYVEALTWFCFPAIFLVAISMILSSTFLAIVVNLDHLTMATLEQLKKALRQISAEKTALSDDLYAAGFKLISKCWAYQDFIIPQLSPLLSKFKTVSVLEIGPGPKSILAEVPSFLRRRIRRYAAYEPNEVFANSLEEQLRDENQSVLPCLPDLPTVYRCGFELETSIPDKKYDLVLFCHSMYGMKPAHLYIQRALSMLIDRGSVVVFHRDGILDFGDLVCTRTASYQAGVVHVADDDGALDAFACFVIRRRVQQADRETCRELCRSLGVPKDGHVSFGAPEVMLVFNSHANALSRHGRFVDGS
jgi:hypothetical protein